MQCRLATLNDLDVIMKLYESARDFMIKNGNPHQWGDNNWPPPELLKSDIKKSQCYVCIHNEKIAGVFVYIYGRDCDPTYLKINDGTWLDESAYGVVHRLATDGKTRGVGSFCLNWCYEKAGHLRLDTHGDNRPMQSLVKKLGFVHCGTIFVKEDSYPRLAFEKSSLTEKLQKNRLTTVLSGGPFPT
ncbi:MAG: hypothetical protein J6M93_05860 [Succinivibrio sp.]|nr:hypothetical protein [Succinivibrio sp.]